MIIQQRAPKITVNNQDQTTKNSRCNHKSTWRVEVNARDRESTTKHLMAH